MPSDLARRDRWNAWVLLTLAAGCAALVFFGVRRRFLRDALDTYEVWWQERERLRASVTPRQLANSPRSNENGLFV